MNEIKLLEGDGFLYTDGKAQNIIVSVNGATFPFSAAKTIQDLYEAVKKISGDQLNPQPDPVVTVAIPARESSDLERSDIVKCILEPPPDPMGKTDDRTMKLGREYRIIDIYKKNGIVTYYEVLDDASGNAIRIPAMPFEIQRVKKHEPYPVKKHVTYNDMTCECGQLNAIEPIGEWYVGQCVKCGKVIKISRKERERVTANIV